MECQFAISYQKVIFKPKISLISEDKYIFQVLVNILHPVLFLQNHCLVTLGKKKQNKTLKHFGVRREKKSIYHSAYY